jgi:hypothetical protein
MPYPALWKSRTVEACRLPFGSASFKGIVVFVSSLRRTGALTG